MDEDKNLIKWGIFLIGAAAVLFAVWRVMAYQETQRPIPVTKTIRLDSTDTPYTAAPQKAESFEAIRNRELLDPFIVSSTPTLTTPVLADEKITPAQREISRPQSTTTVGNRPSDRSTTGRQNVPVSSIAVNPTTTADHAQDSAFRPGVYQPTAQEELQTERESYLAPFLVDAKKKEEIDQKLSSLSSNIMRALQGLLTPKSKKDKNIEKYLNRNADNMGTAGTSAGQQDPFKTVLNQISGQKAGLVKSMASSFGAKAGQRTGQLMDNMAQDISAIVNSPNLTDQQKAEKIQQLTRDYDRKFEKLNQESQYDKFVSDRIEHDNQQKAALQAKYPDNDELNAKLGQIIDASRERDLELSQRQDLTRDAYFTALQDNHYKTHQELENAIKKAGVSLSGLHQVDNDQAAKDLQERQRLEEEGKIISVARVSSTEETKRLERRLNQESSDMIKQVEASFGKEKAAGLQTILDDYNNAMIKTMSLELSDSDRQKQQMKLRNESNLQILQWQKDQITQMNIPPDQKQVALDRIEQELSNLEKVIAAQNN